MKTREDLYSNEATELLRTISLYKTLTCPQIYRLFPGKEQKTKNLLSSFIKQGRVYYNQEADRISINRECDESVDLGMLSAFWVLLDFIDRVEYHSTSDFPVKISFFSDGELYEITYVPEGQELLVSHAMSNKEDARCIILVDRSEQIEKISFEGIAAFCTVAPDGQVCYFKLE